MPYKDPLAAKEWSKQYYKKNKEERDAKNKLYQQTQQAKDKKRVYREGRKDKVKEYAASYYQEHKDKFKEYALTRDKDKVRHYLKGYYVQNKETIRQNSKRSLAMRKYPEELKKEVLQMVYEDNIKKHGTLTCYLCLKPIQFMDDSLDHKIPASRGGTNSYDNLGITHKNCNNKKSSLTEVEYLEVLNGV